MGRVVVGFSLVLLNFRTEVGVEEGDEASFAFLRKGESREEEEEEKGDALFAEEGGREGTEWLLRLERD